MVKLDFSKIIEHDAEIVISVEVEVYHTIKRRVPEKKLQKEKNRPHASAFKGQGHLALVHLAFFRASRPSVRALRPFSILNKGTKAI